MKFINQLKKKIFCEKGKHKWSYYTAGNRVIEIEDGYVFADIPMRHCEICKREEEKLEKEYELLKSNRRLNE